MFKIILTYFSSLLLSWTIVLVFLFSTSTRVCCRYKSSLFVTINKPKPQKNAFAAILLLVNYILYSKAITHMFIVLLVLTCLIVFNSTTVLQFGLETSNNKHCSCIDKANCNTGNIYSCPFCELHPIQSNSTFEVHYTNSWSQISSSQISI